MRSYQGEFHTFRVRDRDVRVKQQSRSLSGLNVRKVALPRYEAFGDLLRWILTENIPNAADPLVMTSSTLFWRGYLLGDLHARARIVASATVPGISTAEAMPAK